MHKLKKLLIFVGDVLILYGTLAITLLIRYLGKGFKEIFSVHLGPFTVIFILWILVFYLFNLYGYKYKVKSKEKIFRDVLLSALVASFLSITSFYLFPEFFELTPKTNLVIFAFVFVILKYGWQWLVFTKIFPAGAEKILILGESDLTKKTIEHIKNNPHIGYKIEEHIKDLNEADIENLPKLINEKGIHTIVIQNHLTKKERVMNFIYKCLTYEINVINFWSFYEEVFEKVPLEELEETWFIENITAHRPMYDKIKRVIDIIFSFLTIIIFSPLFLFSSLLVKFSSEGSIIYKSKRTGKDNKSFILYKFRTMYDKKQGPLWTKENDSRITPVGGFLRKTHLDELPQLINILKGNISVIGPRPERVELVKKFENLPYYDMRHIIKPGLTGWAQINYRASASLEEAKEKLSYDIYYIKNRSVFLDLAITLKTIRYFFTDNH